MRAGKLEGYKGNGRESYPESGDWRAKIKLHSSDALEGQDFERFVDLARPMFYRSLINCAEAS
jgi:hypothetical protein